MKHPQRFLVTGATSGIGKGTACALAKRGHHLIVSGRDLSSVITSAEQLRRHGAASVEHWLGDFSDPDEVTRLVSFLRERAPLDGLVLAAGILEPKRHLTTRGIELNYAVNHLSKFVLLDGLGEHLARVGARIVLGAPVGAVTSSLDDINGEKSWSMFQGIATSQYANDLLASSLSRRWGHAGLRVLAWNPGSTRGTRVARTMPPWARILFWLINLGGRSLEEVGEQGAELVAHDPGKALSWIRGRKSVEAPKENIDLAARSWQMNEALVRSARVTAET